MKKKIDIQQTFHAIRQLPLEVSYQQVEAWVRQQPLKSSGFWERFRWYLQRYFRR